MAGNHLATRPHHATRGVARDGEPHPPISHTHTHCTPTARNPSRAVRLLLGRTQRVTHSTLLDVTPRPAQSGAVEHERMRAPFQRVLRLTQEGRQYKERVRHGYKACNEARAGGSNEPKEKRLRPQRGSSTASCNQVSSYGRPRAVTASSKCTNALPARSRKTRPVHPRPPCSSQV